MALWRRALDRASLIAWSLLAVLLAAPGALAHGASPLPGDSLARATALGATPARAFEELSAGEPHYFRFEAQAGEEVRLRLFAPAGEAPSGLVLAAVFGAELPHDTPVPADFERPNATGALIFPATERADNVDTRIPARFTQLLDRALVLDAGEHVLVLRSESAARVAIFLEGEPSWWLDAMLVPGLRAEARAFAATPMWATIVAGALGAAAIGGLAYRAPRGTWPLLRATAWPSAALFAASLGLLALDAARAGALPWLALAGNAAAIALAAWAGWPAERPTPMRRVALAAAGIVALLAWAGFLWGPMLALAGAMLPDPEKR